jgi:nickel transport protein
VPAAGGYVVTMNAGDGHFAEVALGPDRFGPALPQTAVAPRAASPVPEPTGDGTAPPMAPAALEALVERAVARQVRPLAEAQAEADSRIRLRDIAGGLGWIAGLAGLALALRRGRP